MSTRATIHFQRDGKTLAIAYRHADGYPEGLGKDLDRFFAEISQHLTDQRFQDPSYLAAKWIVFDAAQSRRSHPLDFLGVGVVIQDPDDIRYRYLVNCNGGKPTVEIEGDRR